MCFYYDAIICHAFDVFYCDNITGSNTYNMLKLKKIEKINLAPKINQIVLKGNLGDLDDYIEKHLCC